MDIFKFFIPLSKMDEEQRMVYGYASTDALDSQGEVIARAAVEEALPDYMRFANIREMHTMSAVGVAKSAEMDDKGLFIGVKVVDDSAWEKVKEGVYKGFSVGGKALAKAGGTISKMRLTEISLVDRPANPECVFDTWKADGTDAAEPVVDDRLAAIRKMAEAVSYEAGKPIWDASRALSAMDAIFGLMLSEASEKEQEPGQLSMLQAAIDSLKAFVIAELQERTENGAAVAMGEGEGDISKAGARYSKATKDALAKVHGMLRECDKAMSEMGYEKADDDAAKGEQPAAEGEAIEKADEAAPVADEVAELAKAAGIEVAEGAPHADIVKAALDALAKASERVKELEAQPEEPKVAATNVPVAKGDDTNGGLADTQPDPRDPLSMFKAVLSRPITMGR